MNIYKHVATVTSEVHDSLVRWARRVLIEADLEEVEVYGQFPPKGTVRSHVVLFPYRVGPEPKMMENAPGISLLTGSERMEERALFVPTPWLDLGNHMGAALERLFPFVQTAARDRGRTLRRGSPYPFVDELPGPLRKWYSAAKPTAGQPWTTTMMDRQVAIAPSLWWKPGIQVTIGYVAIAGEVGRGTQATERTSASAPLALSALSVLATSVQIERELFTRLPPLPYPPELETFGQSLVKALEERKADGDLELAGKLRRAVNHISEHGETPYAIIPVHDLSNQEFALLMQAMQRPLQAALNLRLRLPLASRPVFGPSVAIEVRPTQAPRGEGS